MSKPVRLCIFARAPVLGEVKTRLAKAIGMQAALAAYEELVGVALGQLANVPGQDTQLWIAGDIDHPRVLGWSQQWRLPVVQQQGENLGARMRHAVESCLSEGARALVVGTDCPGITADYVRQAARVLERRDLVLGPAEDGGYGLIGLRKSAPELFESIPWGSASVLQDTLERARDSALSFELLETIWDVDEPEDWARYLRNNL